MTLEELQKEEKELRTLIAQNIEKQKKLNKLSLVELSGMDIGDKIIYHRKEAVICGFTYSISGKALFTYKNINKSGPLSKLEKTLYFPDYAKLIQKGFMKPEDFQKP